MLATLPQVHLTPSDTALMFADAWPWSVTWASNSGTLYVGDPIKDTCTSWSCLVRHNEPGTAPVRITHERWLTGMREIVDKRARINLHDSIIDQIELVLTAPTNEAATDEVCQLDVEGLDAIMQYLVLGELVYG